MDAAQKSFELQTQVRHNAEIVKNTLNDLYNWEKEIKDKEKNIKNQLDNNNENESVTMPVRSHINKEPKMSANSASSGLPPANLTNGFKIGDSSEKRDTPNNPLELKRKEANEIKDCGNKYVKLAEYAKAIEAYTRAIEMYADDAVYYTNRALCYLKLERHDECIEDCDQAIEIDRLAVKAYYRRMLANESLGNNMDALKDCTTVLMIEPKNSEAKRSLERINERLRKNVRNTQGPNFTPLRPNLVDISPIDKPSHMRSTKPLSRLAIADVIGPKESKNYDNLTISDEDIDKLFNSNCGHFEEIKEPSLIMENNKMLNTTVPKLTKEEHLTPSINSKETENLPTRIEKADCNNIEPISSNKREQQLPPAPTSTAQFYSNWKELSPKQKFYYLKSIPLNKLCKILGAGFDSDTLTGIINTLHDFYLVDKDPDTANTLLEVSKNKQISILSMLMSKDEHKVLAAVIDSLKEINSADAATVEQIKNNFNLNSF